MTRRGKPWSHTEVWLTVVDYFSMLSKELHGEQYNKTEHRNILLTQLNGRSKSAIEFKHQNISAVLVELGLPSIDGYKPHFHFQKLLFDVVVEYVENHDSLLLDIAIDTDEYSTSQFDFLTLNPREVIVTPPEFRGASEELNTYRKRVASKYNFQEQEIKNRVLGFMGEEFTYNFEKTRLTSLNRIDLAKKVEWISRDKGDGSGFDILSFDTNGEERFIEVKTTNYGKRFPFLITENEVLASEELGEQYFLYRVFAFNRFPKLFMVNGPVSQNFSLRPKLYQASI